MPLTAAQKPAPSFEGKMSVKPKTPELLLVGNLPDQAILPKAHVVVLTNLSGDTLDRLHQRGEGPPRIQLSPRRVGYPVGGLRRWLQERTAA
jgi:predicted DNA-binding transcriptional regulator AlpA